jgi:hypothetical protein
MHTPSILDILTHTPVWVWALFAFILYMGYQRTKDRIVSLWRILLLPGIMALVSVSGWINAGVASLPAIAVGLVVGGTAGWLLERQGATRRLENNKLWLRGEWWSLVQIVLIIGFRYTMAIMPFLNPSFAADPTWHLASMFISSLLSALFVGRVAARLRVFFTSAPAAA